MTPKRSRRGTGLRGSEFKKGKGGFLRSALSRALFFALFMFLVTVGMMIPGQKSRTMNVGGVLAVTDASFKKEVIDSDLPVLVDFWATWCGPCRRYGPIVDQVAQDYRGRLKVVRIDIDQNPELTQDFQINGIPDSILFQRGKVIKTWVGLVTEDDLKGAVDQVVGPAVTDRNPKASI